MEHEISEEIVLHLRNLALFHLELKEKTIFQQLFPFLFNLTKFVSKNFRTGFIYGKTTITQSFQHGQLEISLTWRKHTRVFSTKWSTWTWKPAKVFSTWRTPTRVFVGVGKPLLSR